MNNMFVVHNVKSNKVVYKELRTHTFFEVHHDEKPSEEVIKIGDFVLLKILANKIRGGYKDDIERVFRTCYSTRLRD